jgi:hypothetical protein
MTEDSDMDILNEFLHPDLEEDGEEEDYSIPPLDIEGGPPSQRVRERREHQTSSQSNYLHLKVHNNI